jgi:hypothetical protein
MKICPKCKTRYSDPTLEFCLEDGVRLVLSEIQSADAPSVTLPNKPNPVTLENTVAFPSSRSSAVQTPAESEIQSGNAAVNAPASNHGLKKDMVQKSERILEISPLIIALAHNWWQWVYLNDQYYSSFSSYVFSANFLMWLLLLGAGLAVGLPALKRSVNRDFAIAGLVVLAINLLLFIVPRR